MSGPLHTWYSLPDLGRLAERGVVLTGEIGLAQLARLKDVLGADRGSVRASLSFRHSGGWLTVAMEYEATLELVCQRCLEPLAHHVDARVEMGLLEERALEKYLPAGCEPLVLEGDRLLPAQLVEDELLMSLPLVPRHARIEQCGELARDLESSH